MKLILLWCTISGLCHVHLLDGLWVSDGQIHANQSGFRQKHSCQTARVKLIGQWLTCIDKGNIIDTVFLDFRKAFDLVDHSILIEKLSLYKCKNNTFYFLSSYLHARKQVIENGQGASKPALIKSGVPQVSILGPTLFFIFINDLPLHMNHCYIDFFADDATYHINGKSVSEVENCSRTVTIQKRGQNNIK